jgi:hypothetical protein
VWVPVDWHEGQMLIDDDVRAITQGLVPGATLSLFMDCCHWGSNSRAAPPRLSRAAAEADRRPRLMTFDRETLARYFAVRGLPPGPAARRAAAKGIKRASPSPGAGIAHFAACRDDEYAWESGGEGDFTRAAMLVFADAVREGWTNKRFIAEVIRGLGELRQHPRLWNPTRGLDARKLLGGK